MKKKLTRREMVVVASMLFGLFFGAGNLIFPVSMGQNAGGNAAFAAIGFCVTGVGLLLLGIAAMAQTDSKSLFEISSLVGKGFAYFFTLLLYLTIGPMFAIPRTATVSFQVGIAPLLPEGQLKIALAVFSFVFFAIVLYFSLRPSEILNWVGRVLNPLFLFFLAILVITALVRPMGAIASVSPTGAYAGAGSAFFTGILEGYNTMDALASLAFGIILIDVIHNLGIKDSRDTAVSAIKAGVFSALAMIVIYCLLTLIGAQSVNIIGVSEDGGIALFKIAHHYFGIPGGVLLGAIITVACIKTSIGLVTSISETFSGMFPKVCRYKPCAVVFSVVSFLIANAGLGTIISFSVPVLMFLYPLTIVLILLGLFGRYFHYKKSVFVTTMTVTVIVSGLSLAVTVLKNIPALETVCNVLKTLEGALPLAGIGMGWVVPAAVGCLIGFLIPGKR